jgi:hypothetical protein
LAGCSSVRSAKEPSIASVDRPIAYSYVRSNSVWTSAKTVEEPIPQGVQGHVLQANNALDTKAAHQAPSRKRVAKSPANRNVSSQKSSTGSVGDALDKVLGGRSETQQPTLMSPVEEIITATEIADESTDKESPTK